MWVPSADLPRGGGHPFFERLNLVLEEAGFVAFVESVDIALHEASPDHSTVSRTRRRIDVETHQAVFTWVLQRLADAALVGGKTVGIDATTLEAKAALRSIVRRDTGADYETFLRGLAEASGIRTPTRAELARFDRKRSKKGSNDDWTHPQDPHAKITRMKDGRTRLAHKAERVVDIETGTRHGKSMPAWRLAHRVKLATADEVDDFHLVATTVD